MQKRREMIIKLKGFEYATSLDLILNFIIYVLAKRQATYVPYFYHDEINGTNA